MSKYTWIITLVLLIAVIALVPATGPITALATDMEMIFDELGKEVVPGLQNASVLNHGLGSAELGNFPHMYFSLSAGATVAPGILKFTNDEEKFENYDLFNNLLEEANLNDPEVRDITDNYAPYPSLRASFGAGLFDGYELSLQAGVVPQQIADMAGDDALVAGITTVGTRLRKVLVRRDRGIPAISAGVGYVYSDIGIEYDLSNLDPLEVSGDEGDPDYTTLAIEGTPKFKALTHSFGVDVRASTRFIRVFYPFFGVSTYYQYSTYEAGIDGFAGTLTVGSNDPIGVTPLVQPFSEQTFNNFNVVLNTGFDLKLWIFNSFVHVNYAVPSRSPGAVVGMRLHF